jgi:hypothetical protein
MAGVGSDGCATTKMPWSDFKAAMTTNWGVDIDDYYPVATKYVVNVGC